VQSGASAIFVLEASQ